MYRIDPSLPMSLYLLLDVGPDKVACPLLVPSAVEGKGEDGPLGGASGVILWLAPFQRILTEISRHARKMPLPPMSR